MVVLVVGLEVLVVDNQEVPLSIALEYSSIAMLCLSACSRAGMNMRWELRGPRQQVQK